MSTSERAGDRDGRVATRITTDSIDDFAPFAEGSTSADGAVLVFQGRVRETNEGRAVSHLDYEAYGEMAERELASICHAAIERFKIGSVRAAHRVGELALTEVSIAIGVSAPHRDACYEASRWIIEEVKARLPVWKHEHFRDGTSHWVGAPTETQESVG